MEFSWDLVINAIVTGIVLGGFYAAVAIGVTIAFGMLDIVNIAHPAFMIAGAYLAFLGWEKFGFDPFVSMVVFAPCGYLFGRAFYRACLLYTSDAADEEDSVDLGGRRIIKKKKQS